jgi:hypothetical protein
MHTFGLKAKDEGSRFNDGRYGKTQQDYTRW